MGPSGIARPPKGASPPEKSIAVGRFVLCSIWVASPHRADRSGELTRVRFAPAVVCADWGRQFLLPPFVWTTRKAHFMLPNIRPSLVRFLVAEEGPTTVEYAVLLSLIVGICYVAITTLGTSAGNTFNSVEAGVGGTVANGGGSHHHHHHSF
jgi:pilus assembly protein Flp/PilA